MKKMSLILLGSALTLILVGVAYFLNPRSNNSNSPIQNKKITYVNDSYGDFGIRFILFEGKEYSVYYQEHFTKLKVDDKNPMICLDLGKNGREDGKCYTFYKDNDSLVIYDNFNEENRNEVLLSFTKSDKKLGEIIKDKEPNKNEI